MSPQSNDRATSPETMPPANLDAERGVLGSILLDPKRLVDVAPILRPEHFHDARHRKLFEHISAMSNGGGGAIDVMLLVDRLREHGDLRAAGEEAYIADVAGSVAVSAHAKEYAEIVRRKAEYHGLIIAAEEVAKAARAESRSPSALRESLRTAVDDVMGTTGIDYAPQTAAQLSQTKFEIPYLIEWLLAEGQPCILAGPKKVLKTSLALDMAVALSVGGFFLGKFKVPLAVRTAIMSGESGLPVIQETINRIANAAGHDPANLTNLLVTDRLPKIGQPDHSAAMERFVTDNELRVAMLDTAYLCMPSDDAGNMFAVGEKLRCLNELTARTGVTVLLVHHTKKNIGADPNEPPELEHIAWAGYQEWARQWLLVGRREQYKPGTGDHRLWLSVGGSAGHGGLWGVNIEEGTRDDPGGRRWEVEITDAQEVRSETRDRKQAQRQEVVQQQSEDDQRAIVNMMVKLSEPESKTGIRELAPFGVGRFNKAWAAMVSNNTIEITTVKKSNNHTYKGWVLSDETTEI